MLNIFYKQLKSGDSTKICLWLWMSFHVKYCLVFVVVSNMQKVLNFIISFTSIQFTVMVLFYLQEKSDKKKS